MNNEKSAAPVQAQEPVAGKPCPYCGSTDGAHDKAYPHPRAPVQPVAVPDGLSNAFVTLESDGGRYSIVMKFNQKTDAFAVHDFLLGVGGKDYNSAAPAAQGDALNAKRYEFLRAVGPEQQNIIAHYAMEEMDKVVDAAIAAKAAS